MRCPIESGNGAETMLALAAGRLTPAEQEAFEQHRAGCEACARMAAQQASVWNALDEWTAPAVSDDFDARLMARISEPRRWWQFRWDFSWKPALPVGAACLALIGAFLLHNPRTTTPETPAPVAQVQQNARVVDVDQVESTLDDLDMLNQLDAPASPPHNTPAGS